METKIQFEARYPTNKGLREFPKLNLTGKNKWTPSSVSLGYADSTWDQIQEPGFKEQLIFNNTKNNSQNNKIQQCSGRYTNKANIQFD